MHVHVAMKVKIAVEQPSGKGNYTLYVARAVHSCTCYAKFTHNGHVYVNDNALR